MVLFGSLICFFHTFELFERFLLKCFVKNWFLVVNVQTAGLWKSAVFFMTIFGFDIYFCCHRCIYAWIRFRGQWIRGISDPLVLADAWLLYQAWYSGLLTVVYSWRNYICSAHKAEYKEASWIRSQSCPTATTASKISWWRHDFACFLPKFVLYNR